MKKQIFLLTLLLSVAASAFAAEEVEIDGLWYEVVSKTKEAWVIQYKNSIKYSGNIVIPETVEYEGNDYSVTSIGSQAFYEYSGLTSVTIPGSVTSIGSDVFHGCSGLTSVHISDLEAWCKIAFNGSMSNPLHYAHHLFLNGEEIKDLVIPNSVTSIGKYAFYACSGLTSVTIPNSVTGIGINAFWGCSGLTSVTIPEGMTGIGAHANQYSRMETSSRESV